MGERAAGVGELQISEGIKKLLRETEQMAQDKLTPKGLAQIREYRDKVTSLPVEELWARFNI